jgi:polysaccharide deacetylase family protein (PEP-CTERM system associated)
MPARRVALTVDVEFFDSAFRFRERAPDQIPNEARTMGIEGIEFVADLLERHGARGTFFTLGEVAEQIPETIADLVDRGHEVASHGYSKSHPDLRECSEETVREELGSSKRILENVTGEGVDGFRAPAFALDDDVIKIAAEQGYAYDSSVVPCRRIPGFYGTPDAPTEPFSSELWFSTSGVTEFPMATAPLFRLPVSGAWMRLLGRRYALWGVRSHAERHPATVLYVHPWELVDVPQYDSIPKRVAWRTGQYTRETLSALVSEHASHMATMRTAQEEFTTTSETERST